MILKKKTITKSIKNILSKLLYMKEIVLDTETTGISVKDAIIPGKCAEPPAPAIITAILFFFALEEKSYILFGVR